jgi:hypothetical protein
MPFEPTENYWLGDVLSAAYVLNKKGNPQVELRIRITDMAKDGQWSPLPEPDEQKIYMQRSGGATVYTDEALDQLGFNGDFGNMQFDAGKRVQFESYMNEYNGTTSRKFRVPMKGADAQPVTADQIREENARWRMAHAKKPTGSPPAPPKAAAPAAKPAAAAPPAPTGSDIPF